MVNQEYIKSTVNLSLLMLGQLELFTIMLILLTRYKGVNKYLLGKASCNEKVGFSAVFGVFGIIATFLGTPLGGAIVNSRAVWVVLAGILGGPWVGLSAGIIAGTHRFLYHTGGLTTQACGIATVVEGFFGAIFYSYLTRKTRKKFDPTAALITGLTMEALHMLIILIKASPFDAALDHVKLVAIPMITVNAIGIAIFVEMLFLVSREQELFGAKQAQIALNIAERTLQYLRNGLNNFSAAKAAQIIIEMTKLDAVAITDESRVLAHIGAEQDHHHTGDMIMTSATKEALKNGIIQIPATRQEIGCEYDKCRLGSAIVVPLKRSDKAIGTLTMYRLKEHGIGPLDRELANGLAHLFATQLELAEIEKLRNEVADAKIRALQSQITPHFLGNAINTIVSYIRTAPDMARVLLIQLGVFFRKIAEADAKTVPLSNEIEHCNAYLDIEKARFEGRVVVAFDIDDTTLECRLPPLILQPLVENAVRHGILKKEGGGMVTICAHRENGFVKISVSDNGIGMSREKIDSLLSEKPRVAGQSNSGIALRNVNMRLIAMYGAEHLLTIESVPERGTTISFTIPLGDQGNESIHH